MKLLYGVYLWAGLLGLISLPAARAVVLAFQPAAQTFSAGDAVRVDVVAAQRGEDIVAAYDLDLRYDAEALAATQVGFSAALGMTPGLDRLESVTLLPGQVTLAAVSLLSDADLARLQAVLDDPMPLVTMTFTALAAGNTGSLGFAPGGEVIGSNNRVIFAIPAPGTALLLGAGLAASWVLRRKKIRTG